jgi:hypothetical protein
LGREFGAPKDVGTEVDELEIAEVLFNEPVDSNGRWRGRKAGGRLQGVETDALEFVVSVVDLLPEWP